MTFVITAKDERPFVQVPAQATSSPFRVADKFP